MLLVKAKEDCIGFESMQPGISIHQLLDILSVNPGVGREPHAPAQGADVQTGNKVFQGGGA